MKYLRTILGVLAISAIAGGISYAYAQGAKAVTQMHSQQSSKLAELADTVRSDDPSDTFNNKLTLLTDQFCFHNKPNKVAALNQHYKAALRTCQEHKNKLQKNHQLARTLYEARQYAKSVAELKDQLSTLSATSTKPNQLAIQQMISEVQSAQPPATLHKAHTELLASLQAMNTVWAQLEQATKGYDQAKVDQAANTVIQHHTQLQQALTALQTSITKQEAALDQFLSTL